MLRPAFLNTLLISIVLTAGLCSSSPDIPPQPTAREHWADSVLQRMPLKEQVGQLFMIAGYSNKDLAHELLIDSLIRTWKPGGIIMFQGTPAKHSRLVARWQGISKLPLLVSMDAEWGPSMRLDSLPVFPRQMTLGAIRNDSLIWLMGKEIGRELNILGVHLNFAPVVDVNNNPANPVINSRSFGENPIDVGRKGIAYTNGLRDAGVLGCAKHFPGHGDTEQDSHETLPTLKATRPQLDSIHLPPFKALISDSVATVMTGHLNIPSLDGRTSRPASLSEPITTGLLRTELGFFGLIVTDALGMKGVSAYFSPEQIAIEALRAGADILLMPQDFVLAYKAVMQAIATGVLDSSRIASSCRKILLAKYDAGLAYAKPITYNPRSQNEINTPYANVLIEQLYRSSLVLVRNEDGIVPLQNQANIALVTIGGKSDDAFANQISSYINFNRFTLPTDLGDRSATTLSELDAYGTVIISLHAGSSSAARNYGVPAATMQFIAGIASKHKVVLNISGSCYILAKLVDHPNIKAIIVSHEDKPAAAKAAALALCGALDVDGVLPVTASQSFAQGCGLKLQRTKLSFAAPEAIGIDSKYLYKLDSIATEGMQLNAYPGCRVIVAKDGWIFYDKSFGALTYKSNIPVQPNDLYDLASVTKMAASALAIMKLYEDGKIDIDQTIGHYIPEAKGTNKEKIIIREMLAHQARLKPWIPFYKETLPFGSNSLYSGSASDAYGSMVVEGLYIKTDYRDTILERILQSDLEPNRKYLYSDLGYYLVQRIIESVSGMTLDKYLDKNFYEPMGLTTMGYLPLESFPAENIAPTENDTYYRNCLIRGYVHDQGAAMLGGVSGHAGLFSNAFDLAAIMQLFLDGGVYGGKRYLKESTIREFTKQQFPLNDNRRGMVFDKPNPKGGGQVADEASSSSYGHSGFTGTFAWADPANGMVYVFLSNRVHPDANNQMINKLDTRRNIQAKAYSVISGSSKALPR